jgi:hypothetical protein
MSTTTGANVIFAYRWEDDGEFNQDVDDGSGAYAPSDTTNKNFGANESLDTADRANNPERMNRPFSRSAEQIIEAQFDGSWSTEFVLANTWWLQYFYGKPAVQGTSAPFTHTYDVDPTVGPDDTNIPRSAHLIEETHHSDGTVKQTVYKGAVATSIDVDISVEDTVSISIDGDYADEVSFDNPETNSPLGEIGTQPKLEYRPMHYGNGILRMDVNNDGTIETRRKIQDAGISLEGNTELARELGTRFAVAREDLAFEPSLDYTSLVDGDIAHDERESVYGASAGSTTSSPQETLDGSSIDGELEIDANTSKDNKVIFNILGAFPDDYSRSGIGAPDEALEEDITRMIAEVTVEVKSDEETPP